MNIPVEGEVLAGKYRVERILGKGGMGIVVAATHLQLGQRVAIKFLLQNATTEIVGRFIREARAAVRLKSDHAARVLDVGDLPDGAPYMVMEYLEGNDLSQLLKSKGVLPTADAVLYLLHTCEAIAEAHSIGIIHRDLKPANLFLTRGADGGHTIKVLDFGISKTLDEYLEEDDMGLTKTSSLLGSPLYMSPEQLRSARGVTVQSDIWSLGAILYQLLAGEVPFNTRTFTELVMMVNMQQPPLMTTRRSDVPPALEAAALRCLEKKPEARFANVGELALAIADHGPPEARASAEKTARTLEAVGVRVQRPTGAERVQSLPPAPIVTQEQPSVAPPAIATLAGASTSVVAPPRATRSFALVGIAAALLIVGASLALLTSRRGPAAGGAIVAPPPAAIETAATPTATASASAIAAASSAPEPTVVAPRVPPTAAPEVSAALAIPVRKVTPGHAPSAHPTSAPTEATAPQVKRPAGLAMPLKQ